MTGDRKENYNQGIRGVVAAIAGVNHRYISETLSPAPKGYQEDDLMLNDRILEAQSQLVDSMIYAQDQPNFLNALANTIDITAGNPFYPNTTFPPEFNPTDPDYNSPLGEAFYRMANDPNTSVDDLSKVEDQLRALANRYTTARLLEVTANRSRIPGIAVYTHLTGMIIQGLMDREILSEDEVEFTSGLYTTLSSRINEFLGKKFAGYRRRKNINNWASERTGGLLGGEKDHTRINLLMEKNPYKYTNELVWSYYLDLEEKWDQFLTKRGNPN